MCADAFGKYISHLYSENDYSVEPEVVIPCTALVKDNIISEERIKEYMKVLPPERFEREYSCKSSEKKVNYT